MGACLTCAFTGNLGELRCSDREGAFIEVVEAGVAALDKIAVEVGSGFVFSILFVVGVAIIEQVVEGVLLRLLHCLQSLSFSSWRFSVSLPLSDIILP